MRRLIHFASAIVWIASCHATSFGDDPVVFEQVNLKPEDNAGDISRFIIANDFQLLEPTRLTGLEVWLTDAFQDNDNNMLDNFSGTLSWAFYVNNLARPDRFIISGHDSQPKMTDVGFQGGGGADLVSAVLELPDVRLEPGIYWLALHEGEWMSPSDQSSIGWYNSKDPQGNNVGFGARSVQDTNETADVRFWEVGSSAEFSFRLSGVVVPEPTGAELVLSCMLPLWLAGMLPRRDRIRRRHV